MSVGRCGRCAGGREVSERFSSSSRPAAHRSMSVDSSLCYRCRARSARGVRTARERCGACTRSARASCCAISYCAELGSGGGGWPSQTARGKRFLGRSDVNQQTVSTETRARSRRVFWSEPISTIPPRLCRIGAPDTAVFIRGNHTVGQHDRSCCAMVVRDGVGG